MIYYYTGTGNTCHAAKRIAEITDDKIARIGFDGFAGSGDATGIFFPVYFYGVPKKVREFVSALPKLCGYVYLFMTCGGTSASAPEMMKSYLKANGTEVSAVFDCVMPDNYIRMYDIPPQSVINSTLASAENEINAAADKIAGRVHGDFTSHRGSFKRIITFAGDKLYKPMGQGTKHFTVNDDCIGCGKCASGCADRAIVMLYGKPKWTAPHCTGCLSCINRCPRKAINIGKGTLNRGRYVHPEFTL